MDILLVLGFLTIGAVDLWAASAIFLGPRPKKWRWSSYGLLALVALIASVLMTSHFSYYSNPNTHVFGWPIPLVIFQRDTPTSQWLDYVGPTVVLAYPLNFLLYMFFPSLAYLIVVWIRKRRKRDS